jgi:hypothetical protein
MEGFVNIPVPVEYVPQVYALLGKLAGEPEEGSADQSKEQQMASGEWTEEHLQQLSAEPRASVARAAKMLDLLSKEPDRPIAYAEVARSLGITHGELQGALSGFSRWIRSIWGDDDAWPMKVTSRRPAEGQDPETHYIVTATTAKRWLAVRSRS